MVFAALGTQIAIGALILFVPVGKTVLGATAIGVNHVLEYGNKGIEFMFGGLVQRVQTWTLAEEIEQDGRWTVAGLAARADELTSRLPLEQGQFGHPQYPRA